MNVLDFIGNYEKAGRVRFLLTGKTVSEKGHYAPADQSGFPEGTGQTVRGGREPVPGNRKGVHPPAGKYEHHQGL